MSPCASAFSNHASFSSMMSINFRYALWSSLFWEHNSCNFLYTFSILALKSMSFFARSPLYSTASREIACRRPSPPFLRQASIFSVTILGKWRLSTRHWVKTRVEDRGQHTIENTYSHTCHLFVFLLQDSDRAGERDVFELSMETSFETRPLRIVSKPSFW